MRNKNLEGLYLLQENVSPIEQEIKILEDVKTGSGRGGVRFEAILQEADVENSNRRIYKKQALSEGIDLVTNRIKGGTYFCEMDHPITSDTKRFMTVLLKEASHRVLGLKWEGNLLKAECQTLSTTYGKDLQGMIKDDGIPVGFSLRAIGKTRPSQLREDITEVVGNMRLVCWDAVSNPSHTNALTQRLLEDSDVKAMLMSESQQLSMLSESMGMSLEEFNADDANTVHYDQLKNMVVLSSRDINIRGFLEDHIRYEFKSSFAKLLK